MLDMRKVLSFVLIVSFLSFSVINVSAEPKKPDIVPYSFTYQDILIEAECGDGGRSALATRGTVMTQARMSGIEYYRSFEKQPATGYYVRSRVYDINGIGYIFAIEGYTGGYTVTEYNPNYCLILQ